MSDIWCCTDQQCMGWKIDHAVKADHCEICCNPLKMRKITESEKIAELSEQLREYLNDNNIAFKDFTYDAWRTAFEWGVDAETLSLYPKVRRHYERREHREGHI